MNESDSNPNPNNRYGLSKYLGEKFDIHGGGIDLKFPHHDCEIAQSESVYGHNPANYWIHTNDLWICRNIAIARF